MRALALLVFAGSVASVTAQNIGINATGASPAPSALLDIDASGMLSKGGLLIPRMTTAERNAIAAPAISLLIYNTTNARFEFHDGLAWVALAGGGTLDQAYDFGGTGAGRVITADGGPVVVAGTDGVVSTGTLSSGALAPNGAGTRMVWNPRKAAFRAGTVSGVQWNDGSMGIGSVAFGNSTTASGLLSFATGDLSTASGSNAFVSGFFNTASGQNASAFGQANNASGSTSMALGFANTASGAHTFVAGRNNTAPSFGETVLGIGATSYTPSAGGSGGFGTLNSFDRLFVVGNAIDANNNGTVDAAERSDALVILKNGNTGVGTSAPSSSLHVRFEPSLNSITPTLLLEAAQVGSAANITFQNSITTNSASLGMLAGGDFGLHMGCNFGGCVIGTEAFRVKPNGNFGIGTTNATERLHVVGSIRMVDGNQAAGRVLVSDALGTASWQALAPATATVWGLLGNAGTDPATNFIGTIGGEDLVFRTTNTERMRVLANGNVGLSTAAPTERLEVAGRVLLRNGFSADNAALLYRSNTDYLFLGPQSGSSAQGAALSLYGSTNAVGGNANGMDVNVPGGRVRFNHTNGGFEFRANSTSGYAASFEINDVGLQIGHNSVSRNIQLVNGGGERMRIDASGQVGVGTTAPATRLHVNGAIATTPFATPVNITSNGLIVAAGDLSYLRFTSTGAPGVRQVTLGSGLTPGQVFIAECVATGGNGISFVDGANMAVGGGISRSLDLDDTITFIWNGTKWIEIGYSSN